MRLGILGTLLVVDDTGREVRVTAARQRTLLAALLVRANQMVPVDELAELIWDGAPPAGAARTVRSYMTRLRRTAGPAVAQRIATLDPGYRLRIAEDELDALEFDALCKNADIGLRAADWDGALAAADRALGLWRGTPLADAASQLLREQVVPRFEQLRLQALENRAEARLRLGQHEQFVPELKDLTSQHPLRERFHSQLMLALARCGRQAEALEAYRTARRILVTELGIEPGAELRELHQTILAGDVALAAPQPPAAGSPQNPPAPPAQPPPTLPERDRPRVVPRQLPAEAGHFTGRVRELRTLAALLDRAEPDGGAVVISAIGGTAGIGKTALAVHWGHLVAARFPDGQLYVNLRGYDTQEPLSATDALAGFLRALGVDGRDIPPQEAERAALYRSLLSGRRMLVVLDNARGAHQVRPLIPGTAGCVALVTSRDSLAGLAARDGAVRLELDALALGEATELLGRLLGPRSDAAPAVLAELAERCCRLPLALRLAAQLAAARPAVPLRVLAAELADLQCRLDALDADGDEGAAVRGVLSWSYRNLDADTAQVFRLAALHPGTDFDAHAVAALAGLTCEQADQLLGRLARAHLLHTTAPAPVRYGMHDLLRAYGRERTFAEDGDQNREAALTGLLDYYLHTAAAAMTTLYPTELRRRPALASPPDGLVLAPVAAPGSAREWLDAERANLIAVTAFAADHGWPTHAAALAATVERYFSFGYHLADASAIHGHARRAAQTSGDRKAEATALSHLGFIAWMQSRFGPAAELQQQALALFEAVGDRVGQARVLHRLTLVERALGDLDAAAAHAAQVLELCRQDGDLLGQARALQSLGITRLSAGRTDEASEHLRRSLMLFDALGDLLGQSVSVKELGTIELRAGRLEAAADLFRRALSMCQETNNLAGQARALSQLGQIHLRQGRREQAAEHQRHALDLYRQVEDRYGEAETLGQLGLTYLRSGRRQEALTHLGDALLLARELGTRRLESETLNSLGEVLSALGDPDQARTRHAAALELAVQAGDLVEQARARRAIEAIPTSAPTPVPAPSLGSHGATAVTASRPSRRVTRRQS